MEIEVYYDRGYWFGFPGEFLADTTRLENLTAVPWAPEFLAGMAKKGNESYAVIDLRKFLRIRLDRVEISEENDPSLILWLSFDDKTLGLLAQKVGTPISVEDKEIERPLIVGSSLSCVIGKLRGDARNILIFDPRTLFISPDACEIDSPGVSEEDAQVFEDRAISLAQPLDLLGEKKEINQYIVLKIRGEAFAIAATNVKSLQKASVVTSLPGVFDFVEGLINFQGDILGLLRLEPFLGMRLDDRPRKASPGILMVIEYGEKEFGVLVEEDLRIIQFDLRELSPLHEGIEIERAKFLKGIYLGDELPISVIDLEKMMKSEKIRELEEEPEEKGGVR